MREQGNTMHRRPLRLAAFLLVGLARLAFICDAQENKPAGKTSSWKPEDVIYGEGLRVFRISPDGQWVAWIKDFGNKDKDGVVSNLYLTNLQSKQEIQLT